MPVIFEFQTPGLYFHETPDQRRTVEIRPAQNSHLRVEIRASLGNTMTPQQVITADPHILALLTCQFFDDPGEPIGDLIQNGIRLHGCPPGECQLPRDYFGVQMGARSVPVADTLKPWVGAPLPKVRNQYTITDSYRTQMRLNHAAGAIHMFSENGKLRSKSLIRRQLGNTNPATPVGAKILFFMWHAGRARTTSSFRLEWNAQQVEPAFELAVWGGWSMPDLMAYFGSLATPQNKLYALMGDGSEEATLWARPKPGAVPVKLSWSPGVSKTPSYYVVVQR